MKMQSIDYHRNGICGAGFYTGIIKDDDDSIKMFVHFADYDEDGHIINGDGVRTAILDADLVGEHETRFFHNSWRGDHYHDFIVKEAIKMIKKMEA